MDKIRDKKVGIVQIEREKAMANLTAQFLCTQLEQIQLWKADDVCIERLTRLCNSIADDILRANCPRLYTDE